MVRPAARAIDACVHQPNNIHRNCHLEQRRAHPQLSDLSLRPDQTGL